jgi:hypothetical protein
MGQMKKQAIDLEQATIDRNMAALFGLTEEEGRNLQYHFDDEMGTNGEVLRTFVTFDSSNAPEVLKKIKGMDASNTVYFDPEEFYSRRHSRKAVIW